MSAALWYLSFAGTMTTRPSSGYVRLCFGGLGSDEYGRYDGALSFFYVHRCGKGVYPKHPKMFLQCTPSDLFCYFRIHPSRGWRIEQISKCSWASERLPNILLANCPHQLFKPFFYLELMERASLYFVLEKCGR